MESYELTRQTASDRRHSLRFPASAEVRYKVLSRKNVGGTGTGHAVEISSKGVVFTTDASLDPGTRLQFSMRWPILLDGSCRLKFVAELVVVRYKDGKAAAMIQRWDFRTEGSKDFSDLLHSCSAERDRG